MVRHYGCLSNHSALRKEVVPEPPPPLQAINDWNSVLGSSIRFQLVTTTTADIAIT